VYHHVIVPAIRDEATVVDDILGSEDGESVLPNRLGSLYDALSSNR
jgi:hypothetical protein